MSAPPPDVRRLRPSFVGLGALACVLFLVLGSAPLLGVWWTVALSVLWLVLLLIAVGLFLRRPPVVAVLPLVGLAGWLLGVLVRRSG